MNYKMNDVVKFNKDGVTLVGIIDSFQETRTDGEKYGVLCGLNEVHDVIEDQIVSKYIENKVVIRKKRIRKPKVEKEIKKENEEEFIDDEMKVESQIVSEEIVESF